jgi:hypothetical protein
MILLLVSILTTQEPNTIPDSLNVIKEILYKPTCAIQGDTVYFEAVFAENFVPSSILWYFGDDGSSTELYPNHKYYSAFFYILTCAVYDSIGTEYILKKDIDVLPKGQNIQFNPEGTSDTIAIEIFRPFKISNAAALFLDLPDSNALEDWRQRAKDLQCNGYTVFLSADISKLTSFVALTSLEEMISPIRIGLWVTASKISKFKLPSDEVKLYIFEDDFQSFSIDFIRYISATNPVQWHRNRFTVGEITPNEKNLIDVRYKPFSPPPVGPPSAPKKIWQILLNESLTWITNTL